VAVVAGAGDLISPQRVSSSDRPDRPSSFRNPRRLRKGESGFIVYIAVYQYSTGEGRGRLEGLAFDSPLEEAPASLLLSDCLIKNLLIIVEKIARCR
jgi:hypothetical protein